MPPASAVLRRPAPTPFLQPAARAARAAAPSATLVAAARPPLPAGDRPLSPAAHRLLGARLCGQLRLVQRACASPQDRAIVPGLLRAAEMAARALRDGTRSVEALRILGDWLYELRLYDDADAMWARAYDRLHELQVRPHAWGTSAAAEALALMHEADLCRPGAQGACLWAARLLDVDNVAVAVRLAHLALGRREPAQALRLLDGAVAQAPGYRAAQRLRRHARAALVAQAAHADAPPRGRTRVRVCVPTPEQAREFASDLRLSTLAVRRARR